MRMPDAIVELAEALRRGPFVAPLVEELVGRMSEGQRRRSAGKWLLEEARAAIRSDALRAEQRAVVKSTPPPELPDPRRNRHGNMSGMAGRGCPCEACQAARSAKADFDRQRWSGLHDTIRDMAARLRVQWTAELLGSHFALADGTQVTWGEATRDQHIERAAMFEANVAANAEGAVRHLAAVRDLDTAGVACLNEIGLPS